MNKNWKCPKRSGGGGQTKNPLLWGIFFGTMQLGVYHHGVRLTEASSNTLYVRSPN